MAAKPKLSPEQWAEVRAKWESDQREGYTWLIAEMKLDVSGPAIRKVSIRDGWTKNKSKKSSKTAKKTVERSKTKSNVSKNHQAMVSNVSETIVEDVVEDDSSRGRGRPTLYKEEYNEQAYRLCLLGATDEELAEFFHVTEQTINNWKNDYPKFFESLKRGKASADANVAESLYKRAIGYSHPDVHISNFQGEITITDVTKHYPPDTGAAFIWLKNRQPNKWKDKVEVEAEFKLDKDMLAQIEQKFIERMDKARDRQREILIERGILIEHDSQ